MRRCLRRSGSRSGRRLLRAVLVTAVSLTAGCRDDLARPTLGRLDVRIQGAANVDVYVDGELVARDPSGPLGPLSAGTHLVSARRECFATLPTSEVVVEVVPGEVAAVDFVLEAREFGAALVSAVDELTAAPLSGAEILVESSPGVFVPTGKATPALVEGLPCGPTRFVLAKTGYEDTAPIEVRVDTGLETPVAATLGPVHGVLAEMTTYVVCPNCPPSVDELQALQAAHPEDFWVVEWHTRANLPLYDDLWKARESYYTGGVLLGWPMLVVQGDHANLLVGSQTGNLTQYGVQVGAALAECAGDCPYALSTEELRDAASSRITARVKWRGGGPSGGLTLRFLLVEEEVEEVGNDCPFRSVPRAYHEEPVVFSAPGEILVREVVFPVDAAWLAAGSAACPAGADDLHRIVWLQSDATKRVLAVHGGH
ncbi:MAG: hypothetical protein ACT4PE_03370 [Candidatus Eiseniibacteriota bacterium]